MNTDMLTQHIQSTTGDTWFAMFGAIIGASLTMLGVWLTNRANHKNLKIQLEHADLNEKRMARQERLEELYILASHALAITFQKTLLMLSVIDGKISYDSYLDYSVDKANPHGMDFRRIEMLISIYFPMYKEQYDEIISARNDIESHFEIIRKDIAGARNNVDLVKAIQCAQHSCTEAGKKFLGSVQNAASST